MQKFTNLTGVAAPMPIDNVDTDMIIPKQHLKTINRSCGECAIRGERWRPRSR
jgi:3-isopropylmalate dehydratase small subunit